MIAKSLAEEAQWLPISYEVISYLEDTDIAQAPTPREKDKESSDFWGSGWNIHTILHSHDITYYCY